MKKIITILASAFLMITGNAQTTLTTAVDFTVTDLNGNSINLFNILGSGKYVCIDFFFTTCGPCQATVPFFKQAYQNYGCNAHDVYFMSVDLGNTDAQCLAYEQTYIGGPAGFPVISGTQGGGDPVCNAYGITAFPTYILIAPNHNIIEQDMWPISSAATFDTYFNAHSLAQQPCPLLNVNEIKGGLNVNLYPNPATNTLNIATDSRIETYSIYDASGRQVMNEQISQDSPQFAINIESLSAGMYFIELRNEKSIQRLEFSKQ